MDQEVFAGLVSPIDLQHVLWVVVAAHVGRRLVHGYGGDGRQVRVAVTQVRVATCNAARLGVPHEGRGIILSPEEEIILMDLFLNCLS